MIPGSLVAAPGGPQFRLSRAGAVSRIVGAALVVVALVGGMAWAVALSPLHFERWGPAETSRNVMFDEAGTYVLFEEGTGAASRLGSSQLMVTVRSLTGRPVPMRSLIDVQGRSARTYDIGVRRGRAIAEVVIERPGRYVVASFPTTLLDDSERGQRRGRIDLSTLPSLAVGRAGEPSPVGGVLGLVVLAALPLVVGTGLLLVARRRWPIPLGGDRARGGPAHRSPPPAPAAPGAGPTGAPWAAE